MLCKCCDHAIYSKELEKECVKLRAGIALLRTGVIVMRPHRYDNITFVHNRFYKTPLKIGKKRKDLIHTVVENVPKLIQVPSRYGYENSRMTMGSRFGPIIHNCK